MNQSRHSSRSHPHSPEHYMERALKLALRGRGRVSPNPLVGAVVVRDGTVVGEGHHVFERRAHAEGVALDRAGDLARGADLYVNLEPCCHHGRTPPCVERIVKAELRRLFVATLDPDSRVAGRGIRFLKERGVEVRVGLGAEKAERLNEKYLTFKREKRPFVLLKLALTLDGRIAGREGKTLVITGERARRVSHRMRYEYDAILVGSRTVLRDDPALDVRWRRRNRITKVVLDSHLRTPPEASLFESGDPVVLFHRSEAPQERRAVLSERARLIEVSGGEKGLSWNEVLRELARMEVISLIVEGGGRVAASLLAEAPVDRVAFFYGPVIQGGTGTPAVAPFAVAGPERVLRLKDVKVRRIPPDFLVEAWMGMNTERDEHG